MLLFQFQYGTIKSKKFATNIIKIGNFNSSMVRLKDLFGLVRVVLFIFQFQYGTIKSALNLTITAWVSISIPVWYD